MGNEMKLFFSLKYYFHTMRPWYSVRSNRNKYAELYIRSKFQTSDIDRAPEPEN